MDGHVHAFERFGGAARRCKYDVQKPAVLRWEGPQPIYMRVPRDRDHRFHGKLIGHSTGS
jgi:transposase